MSGNMNLVAHVRRTEKGLTKMQIQIPISTRAGMAELSKRLGISQLAIVRSALAAYLLANNAGAPDEAQYPRLEPHRDCLEPPPRGSRGSSRGTRPDPGSPHGSPSEGHEGPSSRTGPGETVPRQQEGIVPSPATTNQGRPSAAKPQPHDCMSEP